MDEKDAERLIDQAVKRAIAAEREEMQKRESRKVYSLTFGYLRHYNDMVSSLKNEPVDEWEQSKGPTSAIIANLDRCLAELKKEQIAKGEKGKYEVLELYFFERLTYEQITEKIAVGDSTPRRWVTEMVGKLAVKLFGADAIRK